MKKLGKKSITIAIIVFLLAMMVVLACNIPKPQPSATTGETKETKAGETTETTAEETKPVEVKFESPNLLVEPAVSVIVTMYSGLVYDAYYNTWDGPYQTGGWGSGVVVNPDGFIVTAGHVVEWGEDEVKYALIDQQVFQFYDTTNWTDDDWTWVYANFKVEGQNGSKPDREIYVQFNQAEGGIDNIQKWYRAELIDFSPWEQRDIAIVRIEGRNLPSALLGNSDDLEVGNQITVIGYPGAADISDESIMVPSVTQGIVSARKMVGGTEVYQVDASAAPGNSGGPVVNTNGDVVGILTMGSPDAQGFNFIRPSNDIKQMVNKNGVENTLGWSTEEFKAGLIAYYAGDYETAIEHFRNILDIFPSHLKAQEYIQKAKEKQLESG
ncbi:MAG: trypsin-like peptidase domain-containing protein [Actinobacteria bacterium]|nr:trypsin-like peptidase domain-containing protein [Actinomycetota bacterium]